MLIPKTIIEDQPKTIIEDQEDHVRLTSDTKQHTSTIQIETHHISFTESVTHVEIDAIRQETLHPTLKTCELKEYKTSVQETLTNVSIDSDKLPSMRRTPYIKRHSLFEKQYSESHDTSQHTPVLSSPPQTQLKKIDEENLEVRTEKSDISSVELIGETPAINKNLMKLGAFEMSPEPSRVREVEGITVQQVGPQSPKTPEIPNFTTVTTLATFQADMGVVSDKKVVHCPESSKEERSNHQQTSLDTRKQSEALLRPSALNKKQKTPTPNKLNLSEDLSTPTLTSPLVSTKLKGMTPRTPLSNRIVGASLDIGTKSQESALIEYEEFFSAHEVPAAFDLSLFPDAFQKGTGAVAISAVYSRFHGTCEEERTPAFCVEQLQSHFPIYSTEKIELLLDVLVSQRLLRPFVVEGKLFWQVPIYVYKYRNEAMMNCKEDANG
ncbi:unnamed protein product [Albugo candida]|nr:unnamed protein product [Albugo candida]|eukprot:CCI43827.1 unnamed protein product [Albugo candida]